MAFLEEEGPGGLVERDEVRDGPQTLLRTEDPS